MPDVTIEIPAERVNLIYERVLWAQFLAAESLKAELDKAITLYEEFEGDLPPGVHAARADLAYAVHIASQVEAARASHADLCLIADRDWLRQRFVDALGGLADYIGDESRGVAIPGGPRPKFGKLLDSAQFFHRLLDDIGWPEAKVEAAA